LVESTPPPAILAPLTPRCRFENAKNPFTPPPPPLPGLYIPTSDTTNYNRMSCLQNLSVVKVTEFPHSFEPKIIFSCDFLNTQRPELG
jgi:hypothetical protein